MSALISKIRAVAKAVRLNLFPPSRDENGYPVPPSVLQLEYLAAALWWLGIAQASALAVALFSLIYMTWVAPNG